MIDESEPGELTREEQEEIYGGPLPAGLTIRRWTEAEKRILDMGPDPDLEIYEEKEQK